MLGVIDGDRKGEKFRYVTDHEDGPGGDILPWNKPMEVDQGKALRHRESEPAVVLFGTSRGLAPEAMERADLRLEPIVGPCDYNHLSVRSAMAIVMDRLCAVSPT